MVFLLHLLQCATFSKSCIYRIFFASKCSANMKFDVCANMIKVKQIRYFTSFAHHVNPFFLEQMCDVTHLLSRESCCECVLAAYLQRCVNIGKCGIYDVCFFCKCLANTIFDFCANMSKFKQTRCFTPYLLPHVNLFFSEQSCVLSSHLL